MLHDKTASAVPVGGFYYGVYHTVVVAPATSNTVAKCVCGISDTLATNVFAQAGKCRVPAIVFACDTAPELETMAPHGPVKVYPRKIDLENTERLKSVRAHDGGRIARPSWRPRLRQRRRREHGAELAAQESPWLSASVFLTGHLAKARLERLLAGLGETGSPGRSSTSA